MFTPVAYKIYAPGVKARAVTTRKDDPLASGFGKRLEWAIDRSKTDRRVLLRALGLAERAATVSEWTGGRKRPGADVLLRLPGLLGVAADWLFYDRGPPDRVEPDQAAAALWEIEKIITGVRAGAKDPHPPTKEG